MTTPDVRAAAERWVQHKNAKHGIEPVDSPYWLAHEGRLCPHRLKSDLKLLADWAVGQLMPTESRAPLFEPPPAIQKAMFGEIA